MRKLLVVMFITLLSAQAYAQVYNRKDLDKQTADYPFIWGAQYYRAPTPAKENWDSDMKRFAELGMKDIKFWLQWRWGHPAEEEYYFDDLDELIETAAKYDLRVTINAIFDVAPVWLYEKYPDAKQIMNNGQPIEPYVVSHRQIGGHPGPCYNHPGALQERKTFYKKAINHLKKHDNLVLWDAWNEPELSFPQRDGKLETLACYCDHCKDGFHKWLENKYEKLETLNQVWGRNYRTWSQVELPKSTLTYKDFIDFREFQGATLMNEAKWRLAMTKELDPNTITYLHVVPNTTQPFNAVTTCMDDFEVSKHCDVFAATMNNGPYFTPQVVSAAQGKVCYNVESHINGGTTSMHQAVIDENALLNDFLPQVGMGIKGFMFWQFRPEILGNESPNWGVLNIDGSDRVVTKAAEKFGATLKPHTDKLMLSFPKQPEVAIWKSQKNEIFHYCQHGNFNSLAESINAYSDFLYKHSFAFNYVNSAMLNDLSQYKVLIMPSAYYLTQQEADAIDAFVNKGGVLLSEAHLGGYSDDLGRHNFNMPGFGLDKKWGIKEVETSTTYRLKMPEKEEVNLDVVADVKKFLKDFGTTGGKYVPIAMNDGTVLWGAFRYAKLEADNATALGSFTKDYPTIITKEIGKGKIWYCGTNIGEGSAKDKTGFYKLLLNILSESNVKAELEANKRDVWVKGLYEKDKLNFMVVRNMDNKDSSVSLQFKGKAKGLFSGMVIQPGENIALPKGFCDMFVVE
ncbi:beta-galactosidase [Carboxylicivirga sp. RSCT41]|uniref:beta-galactosidase n=1 Tax=Carboxylicivirga agarovorans TaxID=3417570 RepID=UPI003D33759C